MICISTISCVRNPYQYFKSRQNSKLCTAARALQQASSIAVMVSWQRQTGTDWFCTHKRGLVYLSALPEVEVELVRILTVLFWMDCTAAVPLPVLSVALP